MTSPAVSRRSFIASTAVFGAAAAAGTQPALDPKLQPTSNFPHQDLDLVRTVVGASHRDLNRVKELVEKCPPLARASWDWGFGDWETALGAASHVGRRDIAEYLISRGARPDIFTFAMLGDLDTVKAYIKAQPGIQRIRGPHGIPLLQHARNAGDSAAEVAKYLEGLGDAGITVPDRGLTADEFKTYTGSYRVEGAAAATFNIIEVKGRLAFQRVDEGQIFLSRQGDHEFSPAGVPEVRLAFDVRDGRALSITGHHHVADFKAVRLE